MSYKRIENFDDGLIIDRPSLKGITRNFSEWSIIIAGWIFWFFLMRPFILFFMWLIGYNIIYLQFYKLEGYKNPIELSLFTVTIIIIYMILRGWNYYNARRFRGRDLRRHTPKVTVQQVADFFKTSPEGIADIRLEKNCKLEFLQNGEINVILENGEIIPIHYDPQNQH